MTDPRDRLGELLHVPLLHGVWDIEGVTQIYARAIGQGLNKAVYTVPAGRVGYITSAFVSGVNQYSILRFVEIRLYQQSPIFETRYTVWLQPAETDEFGISFPAPVRLFAGGYIWVCADHAQVFITATATGFELPAT